MKATLDSLPTTHEAYAAVVMSGGLTPVIQALMGDSSVDHEPDIEQYLLDHAEFLVSVGAVVLWARGFAFTDSGYTWHVTSLVSGYKLRCTDESTNYI